MSVTTQSIPEVSWYSVSAEDAGAQLEVDPDAGLDSGEVDRRLAEYGPNELRKEPPPSVWVVARAQLSNPMNIALLIVGVASFSALTWAAVELGMLQPARHLGDPAIRNTA